MMPRIVVIGGGFAGVKCARVLLKQTRGQAEVVLFSRDNHMVFQPLLPDVAGSSLNPRAIAPPLRQLLPGAICRTETVLDIVEASSEVVFEGHDGEPRRMRYDHLVIACGNVVNLNLLPGMANHALPLKTIGDAIAMRSHVMRQLEKADLAETEEQRRFYLTFVVVGGGFSGVEVAGELNDLIRSTRRRFPNIRADDVMVTLLHGPAQILPEVSPPLRDFAKRRMERRGIAVRCNVQVTAVTRRGVLLADGSKVEGASVICTIGTTANPLVEKLEAKKERGRLVTAPDMRLPGSANVWAVGDCALVPNAYDGKPAPPTAQFGEREGCQCAKNIVRVLRGEATLPFRFKPVGVACGIGGRQGVAELFGVKFAGFIAWWLWRSAFLIKIPSLSQKLKVGIDWAWELVFPRDLSHFRPSQSVPITKAHYGPGEILFRHMQPLKEFYAIERGEVEVVSHDAGSGETRVLLTLGPGSLIGEATVADFMGPDIHVRAKQALDVYVLGKDSLTRLSRALAPVEELIERSVSHPGRSIWRHHQAAMKALAQRTVGELNTSMPLLTADASATLGDVHGRLVAERHGCAVITRDGAMVGICTRSDMIRALTLGATRDTPIDAAMNRKAVSLRREDSAALAAERMAEGGLKFLPVVDGDGRPTALLTSDDFVAFALAEAM